MSDVTTAGGENNEESKDFQILNEREELNVGKVVGKHLVKNDDGTYTLNRLDNLVRDIILYYETK